MGIEANYSINGYNIDTAACLVGPANFGNAAPRGCCAHLVLLVKSICTLILRIFNLICGDHRWYDNETARYIVEQYASEPQENIHLRERVEQLNALLQLRSNGNASYASRIALPEVTVQNQTVDNAAIRTAEEVVAELSGLEHEIPTNRTVVAESPEHESEETRLARQLGEALQLEENIEGDNRASALSEVACRYCKMAEDQFENSPEAADESIQKALNILPQIRASSWKDDIYQALAKAYCQFVESCSETNLEEARVYLQKMIDIVPLIHVASWKDAVYGMIYAAKLKLGDNDALPYLEMIQGDGEKCAAYCALALTLTNTSLAYAYVNIAARRANNLMNTSSLDNYPKQISGYRTLFKTIAQMNSILDITLPIVRNFFTQINADRYVNYGLSSLIKTLTKIFIRMDPESKRAYRDQLYSLLNRISSHYSTQFQVLLEWAKIGIHIDLEQINRIATSLSANATAKGIPDHDDFDDSVRECQAYLYGEAAMIADQTNSSRANAFYQRAVEFANSIANQEKKEEVLTRLSQRNNSPHCPYDEA